MSVDPNYALQGAVYNAIKTFAGGQVYDRVPDGTTLPYIYFGEDDLQADYEAADLTDCSVEVHVYAGSRDEAKLIAGQVRTALDVKLSISGFLVYEWAYESTRMMRDPDGLTEHAVLTFSYLVGPSS